MGDHQEEGLVGDVLQVCRMLMLSVQAIGLFLAITNTLLAHHLHSSHISFCTLVRASLTSTHLSRRLHPRCSSEMKKMSCSRSIFQSKVHFRLVDLLSLCSCAKHAVQTCRCQFIHQFVTCHIVISLVKLPENGTSGHERQCSDDVQICSRDVWYFFIDLPSLYVGAVSSSWSVCVCGGGLVSFTIVVPNGENCSCELGGCDCCWMP